MVHVIAVLGLGAACILWFLVQYWARPEGDAPCEEGDDPHCSACEAHGPDCLSPPATSRLSPDRPR